MNRPLHALMEDLHLPGHRAVAAHWLELHAAAGARLPALTAIDPLRFAKALPDIWIVDAEPDGRFRFRLVGETLVAWYGVNPKGRHYEDIFPDSVLPAVHEDSRRILAGPCIGYQKMHSQVADSHVPAAYERLVLPLAGDDGAPRHLLGVSRFRSHAESERARLPEPDVSYWYAISGGS